MNDIDWYFVLTKVIAYMFLMSVVLIWPEQLKS